MDHETEMKIKGWKEVIADARECIRLVHETDDIEHAKDLLSQAIYDLEMARRIVGTCRTSWKNRKTEGI